MPLVDYLSTNRCRQLHNDYEYILITDKNIGYYAPEFLKIRADSKSVKSIALNSDLLRIILLSKYGGYWIDTSAYPIHDLNRITEKITNKSNFFCFKLPNPILNKKMGNRICRSWFLASEANSDLAVAWRDAFTEAYKKKSFKYYQFHETLYWQYKQNSKIADELALIPNWKDDVSSRRINFYKNPQKAFVERPFIKRPCFFEVIFIVSELEHLLNDRKAADILEKNRIAFDNFIKYQQKKLGDGRLNMKHLKISSSEEIMRLKKECKQFMKSMI